MGSVVLNNYVCGVNNLNPLSYKGQIIILARVVLCRLKCATEKNALGIFLCFHQMQKYLFHDFP